MKRLLSLTALLLLAVTSFAHDFEVGGIYYEITSSSSDSPTVRVSYKGTYYDSYYEYSGNIAIPETVIYNGKTFSVTSIKGSAFRGCSGINSITIPPSVTSIGQNAFEGCTGLTKVIVTDIAKWCKINFTDYYGVSQNPLQYAKHIYSDENTEITELAIPDGVTYITSYAFSGCTGLKSVTIPSSVTDISLHAFSGCTGLKSVTIHGGGKSIAGSAFSGCTGLTKVIVPDIAKWCSIDFTQYDGSINTPLYYAKHLYSDENTEITELAIPDGITYINSYAFSGCSGFTSVTIPEGVTSIDKYAFSGCSGLTSVNIPSSVTRIGENAFSGCTGLTKVIVPDIASWCNIFFTSRNTHETSNPLSYAKHLYSDENTEITELAIPDGVTYITSYAFSGCSGLTSVTIPNSVTSIAGGAFDGCSGLKSITIPSSITSIGSYAFYDCSRLMSVTIPEGVTSIDKYAFSGCSGLTSVNIPSSVTSIGENAFSGTAWYENQSDGVVFAGNVAYEYKGDMPENTSVTLKEGTTGIADYAFSDCSGLTSITIPSSVTSIGGGAFDGCTGLMSITIGDGVKGIGDLFGTWKNSNVKIYVDKNSLSLLKLWNAYIHRYDRYSYSYCSEQLYDVNTGEKIDFFKTNASSVSVFIPEPKNYTITSKSLTVGDKSTELPYKVNGLAPNTSQGTMSLTIAYRDTEGKDQEFTTSKTVQTQELTLTTEQPKVVSMGNVVVSATTNVDPEEKNVGFEWRRTDWTSDFASNSGSAVVYGNTMEGYIRNMNTDKLWTYRAYYLSDAGVYYYGDWVGLDASNTSYFEPTVHTYADISTSGKVALIRGYVLNGTDKITVQGFKYWKAANKGNSLDIAMEGEPQAAAVNIPADAITETVDIVGAGQQLMNATLNNLDYGSTYECVAFATTAENETFYGEVQTFTTEADPTGIEGVKEETNNKPVIIVACYDINGKQISQPQKGLNILKMSDGTTRKVVK